MVFPMYSLQWSYKSLTHILSGEQYIAFNSFAIKLPDKTGYFCWSERLSLAPPVNRELLHFKSFHCGPEDRDRGELSRHIPWQAEPMTLVKYLAEEAQGCEFIGGLTTGEMLSLTDWWGYCVKSLKLFCKI